MYILYSAWFDVSIHPNCPIYLASSYVNTFCTIFSSKSTTMIWSLPSFLHNLHKKLKNYGLFQNILWIHFFFFFRFYNLLFLLLGFMFVSYYIIYIYGFVYFCSVFNYLYLEFLVDIKYINLFSFLKVYNAQSVFIKCFWMLH